MQGMCSQVLGCAPPVAGETTRPARCSPDPADGAPLPPGGLIASARRTRAQPGRSARVRGVQVRAISAARESIVTPCVRARTGTTRKLEIPTFQQLCGLVTCKTMQVPQCMRASWVD